MSNIENVRIIPRKLISDSRGWFLKAITGQEDNLPPYTGEVYLTMGTPGQSKGGHYHPIANEWFTLIEGKALLKLNDIETGERKDIELSLEAAITVFIPHNVAHQIDNLGDNNFILLAYTDQLYDPSDTIAYHIDD